MTDERDIERRLVDLVTAAGGLCLKLDSSTRKGIQDRLLLLPGGRVIFVEVKRPDGGKVSVLQKVRAKQIERLGFRSMIVQNEDQLRKLEEEIAAIG